MNQLLVVGAGASVEECMQSGNYSREPDRFLPLISNFSSKLLQPTPVISQAIASYLAARRGWFNSRLLEPQLGDPTLPTSAKGLLDVFARLEQTSPRDHNIETLCEHVWQTFGKDPDFLDAFVYDGIFFKLFVLFTDLFGLGLGKPMIAGRKVASQLAPGDVVINLNYDIAFDLALKQAAMPICYAPDYRSDAISILKPHGSMNFYVNYRSGDCYFEEPDRISGSIGRSTPADGTFFPHSGLVPPRLHKTYAQHPAAESILNTGRPFSPRIVTFWGLGLTRSDVNLLSVYREAAQRAELIEFINPDKRAWQKAKVALRKNIVRYAKFEDWLSAHNMV